MSSNAATLTPQQEQAKANADAKISKFKKDAYQTKCACGCTFEVNGILVIVLTDDDGTVKEVLGPCNSVGCVERLFRDYPNGYAACVSRYALMQGLNTTDLSVTNIVESSIKGAHRDDKGLYRISA